MRVVFFSFVPLTFWGGAEKYVVEMAGQLHTRGYDVAVVVPDPWFSHLVYGCSTGRGCPERLTHVELSRLVPHIHIHQVGLMDILSPRCRRTSGRAILQSADVVYSKNEIFDLVFLRLLGLSGRRPPVICGIHTVLRYPSGGTLRARLHNMVYVGPLYRGVLKSCRLVHVLNEWDRRLVVEEGMASRASAVLIPNGVDVDKFAPVTGSRRGDGFKVLFAGRLTEQKGVDVLERAVERLAERQEFARMEFAISGSGELEEIALRLANDHANVTYLGHVKDMVSLYRSHDIAVMPSRWEGSPFVCFEAQSCGLPVVATDIPGLADIVAHGESGLLIPPDDSEALCNAILYLYDMRMSRPEEFRRMALESRKRMMQMYSLPVVAQRLSDAVDSIVTGDAVLR